MKFTVIICAPEELEQKLKSAISSLRMLSIIDVTQVVVSGRIVTTIRYSDGCRD